MEGDQTGNSDRELTSTMGKVVSTTSNNEEKTEPNDATPTSSTDASTTPNASQIVSDDPISSTSSDVEQKSKTAAAMTSPKENSCDADTDLLEMSMMTHTSNERITENVEDLVQDLETLLGESTESFNLSRKNSEEVSNENASSSNILNLEDVAPVTEWDDTAKTDECDKSNSHGSTEDSNANIENADRVAVVELKQGSDETVDLIAEASVVDEKITENSEETNAFFEPNSEQLPVLEVEKNLYEKQIQENEFEVTNETGKERCDNEGNTTIVEEVSMPVQEEIQAFEGQQIHEGEDLGQTLPHENDNDIQENNKEQVESYRPELQVQESIKDLSTNSIVIEKQEEISSILEVSQPEDCKQINKEHEIENTGLASDDQSASEIIAVEEALEEPCEEQTTNIKEPYTDSKKEDLPHKENTVCQPELKSSERTKELESSEKTEIKEPTSRKNYTAATQKELQEAEISATQEEMEESEISLLQSEMQEETEITPTPENMETESIQQEQFETSEKQKEQESVCEHTEIVETQEVEVAIPQGKMGEETEIAVAQANIEGETILENFEVNNEGNAVKEPQKEPIPTTPVVSELKQPIEAAGEVPEGKLAQQTKEIIEIQEVTEETNESETTEVVEPTVIEDVEDSSGPQTSTLESIPEQPEDEITIYEITEDEDQKQGEEINEQPVTPSKIEEPSEDETTEVVVQPEDVSRPELSEKERNFIEEERKKYSPIVKDATETEVEKETIKEVTVEENTEVASATETEKEEAMEVPSEVDIEEDIHVASMTEAEQEEPVEVLSETPVEEDTEVAVMADAQQQEKPIVLLEVPVEEDAEVSKITEVKTEKPMVVASKGPIAEENTEVEAKAATATEVETDKPMEDRNIDEEIVERVSDITEQVAIVQSKAEENISVLETEEIDTSFKPEIEALESVVETLTEKFEVPVQEPVDESANNKPEQQFKEIKEIEASVKELETSEKEVSSEASIDEKVTEVQVVEPEKPEAPTEAFASEELAICIEAAKNASIKDGDTDVPEDNIPEKVPERPVPILQLDEESVSAVASVGLPEEIEESSPVEIIANDMEQVNEATAPSSVETPTVPENPIAEELGTGDAESLREEQILPQEPLPEEIEQKDEIEPPTEESLAEQPADLPEPTEDLPESVEEPDETMMAIAGLESEKMNEVFQERRLTEKEIREMEALRMAVASITEGTESYSMPQEIFQESSTEMPAVEGVLQTPVPTVVQEEKRQVLVQEIKASNEVKGNNIDSIPEQNNEEQPIKAEAAQSEVKSPTCETSKLSKPLRISVDEEEKEDFEEEPSSSKISPKPVKMPKEEEEVSTTSHLETDEYKGSLKMTITKKSDKLHSSILKVYNAEEYEQEPAIEEPIPKLIIKPKIQQVEQQHSPKMSTRSSSKVASPTSSQRCSSPRITVKPIVKPEAVSPLKITIKPVVNPDDNSKKHSPKPKEDKIRTKEVEQSQGPKITIKPIPKPLDVEDVPQTSPKITIKPIKRQDDVEEERSSPKIIIKPVLKPDEQECTERVSSPKISIKPVIKPSDEEEKERIVLKINKGNIPTPSKESKKREHSPDDEKSERLPKMKLKFSKEGGHPKIVQESNKRPNEDRSVPEKSKKRKSEKIVEDDDLKIMENINSPIVISDDSRSQHSAEGLNLEAPLSGAESSLIMEISGQSSDAGGSSVQSSPAAPKRRGRPRKAQLEVRPEFPPDPVPVVVPVEPPPREKTPPPPVHDSGRPKRSCRGQNVIATLGIKPRKPRGGGARGRGGKANLGTRELAPAPVPMKPEKEPRLTKAKLRLMQQQAKKQLEEERRLEEILKIKEEARKQLEEQRRKEDQAKLLAAAKTQEIETITLDDSQQSEDVEAELKRKASFDEVIVIPDEEEVIKVETPPPKKSKSDRRRGKKQKNTPQPVLAITPTNNDIELEPNVSDEKLRNLEISLTPLNSSNNVETKSQMPMAAPLFSEPPTPTSSSDIPEIVLVDEETRMSADTSSRAQTPAKQELTPTETIEESQSSSATTESGKAKPSKAPRLEIHQEASIDVITAEQLAEYQWNNQGPFMIQEQIAQYLAIKSFKRKYPNIQRRAVDMQEKDFIKETCLVSEAMCDLGLTAVNSADILDIMYSDFQDKYEEYCKHQRDKQAKELINRQKALSLAASMEKSKADLTEQAVHSAAQWNANFNKTRREQRKAAVDLQTFTVHYPKGKVKQINKPKVGHYPIALVPGQFTDYYKEYTPTEINNLPINTMLYDPINIQVPEDSDSDSGSNSDSDSSSSDSDSSGSSSSCDDCKQCTQTAIVSKVAAK